jgi:tetratricopeptide (TPR) repeat protein
MAAETAMKRVLVAGAAVATLFAGAAALWLARDRRGDEDAWVVSKRETTREESLRGFDGSNALPTPDPPAAEHPRDDSARALNDLARDAWRGGSMEKAIGLYAKAVEADPDDWIPRAQYGRLLAIMRDDARARPQLERAAALAPEDPQRWLDLQTLYEHTQQLDLAFEARRRADALAGGRPIVQDWAGFWTIEGSEPIP